MKEKERPATIWGLLWEFKWYIVGIVFLLILYPIFYGIKTISIGVISGGIALLSSTKKVESPQKQVVT
jgi:hypothetical protein